MSDEKSSSLLSRAWHAALVFLGIAVAAWVAVKLILQVWWVLAVLAVLAAIVSVLVWWGQNRRW